MKANKPETMWVVKNVNGKILSHTLASRMKSSKFQYELYSHSSFTDAERVGYRCVKVEVTIKEVEK